MAPTPTTDLELLKPDANDLYNVGIPNGNMDILEAVGAAPQRVTSATRPSTPKRRQIIVETDTGRIMQWDGDSWEIVYSPPVITSPLVGGNRYDGTDNTLTTLAVNGTEQLTGQSSGSLALEANTAYMITAIAEWDSTVQTDRYDFKIRVTDTAGVVRGLKQNVGMFSSGVREQLHLQGQHHQGAAGSVTFVLTMQRRSGTGGGRVYRSTWARPCVIVEKMGATGLITSV